MAPAPDPTYKQHYLCHHAHTMTLKHMAENADYLQTGVSNINSKKKKKKKRFGLGAGLLTIRGGGGGGGL